MDTIYSSDYTNNLLVKQFSFFKISTFSLVFDCWLDKKNNVMAIFHLFSDSLWSKWLPTVDRYKHRY